MVLARRQVPGGSSRLLVLAFATAARSARLDEDEVSSRARTARGPLQELEKDPEEALRVAGSAIVNVAEEVGKATLNNHDEVHVELHPATASRELQQPASKSQSPAAHGLQQVQEQTTRQLEEQLQQQRHELIQQRQQEQLQRQRQGQLEKELLQEKLQNQKLRRQQQELNTEHRKLLSEQLRLNRQQGEQKLEERTLSHLEHQEGLREQRTFERELQTHERELQALKASDASAARKAEHHKEEAGRAKARQQAHAATKAKQHEEDKQEGAKRLAEATRKSEHYGAEEKEKTERKAETAKGARQVEEHIAAKKEARKAMPSQHAKKQAFDTTMSTGGSQDDAIKAAVGKAVEQAKATGSWEPLRLAQAAGNAARAAGAAPIETGDVIGRTAKGAASTSEEAIQAAAKAADLVSGGIPDEPSKNVGRLVRFAALAAGANTDQAAALAAHAAKETAATKNNYSPREVGKRVTMAAREAGVRGIQAEEMGSDAEQLTKAQREKLKAVELRADKEEKAAACRVAKDKIALQAAKAAMRADGNNADDDDDSDDDADLAVPGLVETSADVADASTRSDEDDPAVDMN